jgi:hypothetical protein
MTNEPNDWEKSLRDLRAGLKRIEEAEATLAELRDRAAAEIAKYLRTETGVELDLDAIQATLTRPYTLLPLNEHEARLVHWRGVKLPLFGWVEKQEEAFTIARVTRSMDLITPLPQWMKQELGWGQPEHGALIDGTRTGVRVTDGDPDTFKRKYGAHLGAKQPDGTYKIKGGGAWIRLVAQLVKDGILPYAPQPVAPEHWDAGAPLAPALVAVLEGLDWTHKRPFLQRAVDEFHDKGAVLVNYPPGAGKTLVASMVLNHFRGRTLILGDTTLLVEQWKDRVKKFAPQADVTISTYQGAAKYLQAEWDLIVPDEAQRLPANTFSKLAFVKAKYRLGLTGTPWREDDRQHLIVALSGFPVALRWGELIGAGVLKRPRIVVATVPDDRAKTAYVRKLLEKRRGRALIFCDWIQQGQQLADDLDVPFIHGETRNKLQRLEEADVAVVSRVGDRGLDLPGLRLVVEVAFAGAAREQFAQRVGRLLHGQFEGEFHTVFTPEEARKYRPRLFGAEAEMAGQVEFEFMNVGDVTEPKAKGIHVGTRTKATTAKANAQPQSEIDQALANPAVRKLVDQAEKAMPSWARGYVRKALDACWESPVTLEEIRIGKGVGEDTVQRFKAGIREAQKAGLISDVGGGRYLADRGKIKKLVELSRRFK